jgi:hypothetical protein
MVKNEFNIKAPNNWKYFLSTFKVGESKEVAEEDIKSVRVTISTDFNSKGLAKFTTKQNKNNLLITITRES